MWDVKCTVCELVDMTCFASFWMQRSHVMWFFFRGTVQMTRDLCIFLLFSLCRWHGSLRFLGMSDNSHVICRYYNTLYWFETSLYLVYVYEHTHIYIYILYIHNYIHIYMYTYMYTYIYIYIYIFDYIYIYTTWYLFIPTQSTAIPKPLVRQRMTRRATLRRLVRYFRSCWNNWWQTMHGDWVV